MTIRRLKADAVPLAVSSTEPRCVKILDLLPSKRGSSQISEMDVSTYFIFIWRYSHSISKLSFDVLSSV